MAIVGSFQEDLDIYLADYKGRSGASKQSDKDLKKIGNKQKVYWIMVKCIHLNILLQMKLFMILTL